VFPALIVLVVKVEAQRLLEGLLLMTRVMTMAVMMVVMVVVMMKMMSSGQSLLSPYDTTQHRSLKPLCALAQCQSGERLEITPSFLNHSGSNPHYYHHESLSSP